MIDKWMAVIRNYRLVYSKDVSSIFLIIEDAQKR